MDRYADGDEAAFGEVYDHLAPRLFAFFVRQTRSRAKAEDLLQQTLLNIHAARASYERHSDVLPWAFAIGRRLLIDARRKSHREVLFDNEDVEQAALDARIERFEVPDALVMTRELCARLRGALQELPETQRAAFLLVREEGLSVAQAAEVLGTTPSAVKLRAHRAYEALRNALSAVLTIVMLILGAHGGMR